MEIVKEKDNKYHLKINFEELNILHYAVTDLLYGIKNRERTYIFSRKNKKCIQQILDKLEMLL